MRNSIVGFIPAREGSKSITLKNIKPILGRPLISWTIDALLNSKCEKVYIYTDSTKIRNTVMDTFQGERIEVLDRPPETATDYATSESGLIDFCSRIDSDIIVFVQATSPLIEAKYIDEGINYVMNEFDSAISVTKQKRFIWEENKDISYPVNYDINNRPRRQDFDGFFVENGAFYISKRDAILKTKSRISGKIKLVETPPDTYIEIDELHDWLIVETLLKEKLKENKKISEIKMLVLDIDGVFTNGSVFYENNGETFKMFNTKDGMGLELLRSNNIQVCVITGEKSKINFQRMEKLSIKEFHEGIKDKYHCLRKLTTKYNINFSNIAYIGDDINDITCMYAAGISFCPNNAEKEALLAADIVLTRCGGYGAIREAIELLIKIDGRLRRSY